MKAKRFLLAMFALLTCIQAWSVDGDTFSATVGGLNWTFQIISETDKTCRVGKNDDTEAIIPIATSGDLIIPTSVNNYIVVEIGGYAFKDCSSLTSVTIPSSVTAIGYHAFYNCTGLTKVNISDLVAWCNIDFNSITSNPLRDAHHLYLNGTEIKDLVIPNSVTKIRNYAFSFCTGLTSIAIPNFVTTIGKSALAGCTGFTSVTIPNSVTTIGGAAFSGCTGLTSIAIPNSVTTIGNAIFQKCTGLTSVTIPNSVTTIGENTFRNCTVLSSVTIPNSVTTIGESAFNGCSSLNSIFIPNSVAYIGHNAFAGTAWLNNQPNGMVYASKVVYKYKGTMPENTNIVLEDGTLGITDYALSGCNGLKTITIPNSVIFIGVEAFSGCTSLASVTVENEKPIDISLYIPFYNAPISNATLYVPVGSKAAYEAADYWKNFGTIVEMCSNITIGSAGMGTFCSTHPLDFSGTDDIKAYIVSAFKPSTGEVTLTRITDVPANTGIVVKGDEGNYTIPWGAGETVVANMLVGVTENTVLNKVDGDYTNYILAKKNNKLGFYAVSDGSTLSAGKAYLPLPTAQLPSVTGARQLTMVFDDETTGIQQIQSDVKSNGDYYDLKGRRVSTPKRGLYIVNGKKVVIK